MVACCTCVRHLVANSPRTSPAMAHGMASCARPFLHLSRERLELELTAYMLNCAIGRCTRECVARVHISTFHQHMGIETNSKYTIYAIDSHGEALLNSTSPQQANATARMRFTAEAPKSERLQLTKQKRALKLAFHCAECRFPTLLQM